MVKIQKQTWIAYLSTFPPRECGIATFTQDLTQAIDSTYSPRIKSKIIALNTSKSDVQSYPSKVIFQIDETDPESYIEAAEKINANPHIQLLSIQHEYGIHGGLWGSNILELLKRLKKPSVLTMHTVSPIPDHDMLRITKEMLKHVKKVIVLTQQAKNILIETYQIDSEKIKVIPHGIHPVMFSSPKTHKPRLGLKNKIVLTTFGLLSRNKGIEYVIKSLPEVIKQYPNLVYLVLGQTHPVVRRKEGEIYRHELMSLVNDLKLCDHVKFIDRYLTLNEIIKFLLATDIYISTSLDPNQTVSGTLSYALGTGRSVISTSFSQAKEVITKDTGILVDFKNPKSYTAAILSLLEDNSKLQEMYFNAFESTRSMLWSNVSISYMTVFNSLAPKISAQDQNLPIINLDHLRRMTDSYGLFQFARISDPDPRYGYTLDDNARAMIATAQLYQQTKSKPALTLTQTYLKFIEQCQSNPSFINYVTYQQEPDIENNNKVDLGDANGRAIWALGSLISLGNIPQPLKTKARHILTKWFEHNSCFDAARPNAFIIKGLANLKPRHQVSDYKEYIKNAADCICDLYKTNVNDDWHWFENSLTYANGIIPEALFLAYKNHKNETYLQIAQESLNFLIENSFQGPIYVPIGQKNWYKKGQIREMYDQQPEDVTAMVQALKIAYQITKKRKYKDLMYKTFYWFLGNNLLGEQVYDKKTGGCFDALTPSGVNLHQGAESTVSYLLARLTVGLK